MKKRYREGQRVAKLHQADVAFGMTMDVYYKMRPEKSLRVKSRLPYFDNAVATLTATPRAKATG